MNKEIKLKVKGIKGDTGLQGEQGIQGISGLNGIDGKDGVNGRDGKDGKDGKDGLNGKDGVNGRDGSTDTAQQVKTKLLEIGLKYDELQDLPNVEQIVNNIRIDIPKIVNNLVASRDYDLKELKDVITTGATDGQALIKQGDNYTFATIGGSTPTLQQVTDEGAITTNSITVAELISLADISIPSNNKIQLSNDNDLFNWITYDNGNAYGLGRSSTIFGSIENNFAFIDGEDSTVSMVINGGNIGIGTTAPTQKLEVIGAVRVAQTTTNAVIIGNVTGNARGTSAIDIQSTRTNIAQVASGANSASFGASNISSGASSISVGISNTTSGLNGSTFGFTNTNSAQGATILGVNNSNNTNSTNSTIVGNGNTITGSTSSQSLIVGQGNTSNAGSSGIIGRNNTISGTSNDFSFILGWQNTITAGSALALGRQNLVSGSSGTAVGNFLSVTGNNAHAFGANLANSTGNSVEIGAESGEKLQISSAGVNFVTSAGGTFTVNGLPIGSSSTWTSDIDAATYSIYNLGTIKDGSFVTSIDTNNRSLNDGSGNPVAYWGIGYSLFASMGTNSVYLDDGTNAINSTGNVKMQGLSSGTGPPATILTNFNLYVDNTTGIVYVD